MLGIVIVCYNIPADVFLLQIDAIKKFCKDGEYRIIIVDNSSKNDMSENLRYHSERLSLAYIRTKASSVDGSDSHAWAANFAYRKLYSSREYKYFFFLDHDCIPVKPFYVNRILALKTIAGLGQAKSKTYFWPGCVMWNDDLVSEIDFSPNNEYGLDTGGNLYKTIEDAGIDNCIFFNEEHHQNPQFNGKRNSYAMINDGMFLHFQNASNWNSEKDNTERLNSLINITKQMTGL